MQRTTEQEVPMPCAPIGWGVACVTLVLVLSACRAGDQSILRDDTAGADGPREVAAQLTIGSESDTSDPASLLAGIGNAIVADSDRLAIVDGGSSSIRLFDARGRFVRSVGRAGSGPGEFRLPTWVGRCPDGGFVAWDYGRKVVSYDSLWRYRSETLLPGAAESAAPLACVAADEVIATAETGGRVPDGGGLVQLKTIVLRLRLREGRVDTVATLAGTEYFFSRRSPIFLDVPLGRATRVAVRARDLVVATTDSAVMHLLSSHGAPVAQWKLSLRRRRASLDDQRRAFDERLEALQLLRTRRMLRPLLEEMPRIEQFPYFETLVADDSARVWVKTYNDEGPLWRAWQVLDDSGRVRATVRLPAAAQVTAIARGCIIAIERDSVGIERVRAYGMRRALAGLMSPCPFGMAAEP